MILGVKEIRVELWLSRSDRAFNKQAFEQLKAQQTVIEKSFGQPLEWLRLDDKKSSRIQLSHSVDGYNKANWPSMMKWLVDNMILLEAALKAPLLEVKQLSNSELV